jgi:hypothetical protein
MRAVRLVIDTASMPTDGAVLKRSPTFAPVALQMSRQSNRRLIVHLHRLTIGLADHYLTHPMESPT